MHRCGLLLPLVYLVHLLLGHEHGLADRAVAALAVHRRTGILKAQLMNSASQLCLLLLQLLLFLGVRP